MNNPLKAILNGDDPHYKLLEGKLKGVVSGTTLYGLLDDEGIPPKTQWHTVEKVVEALGYRIVFERVE